MDQGSDYINNSPDVVVVRRRQVLYEQQLFYYLGDPEWILLCNSLGGGGWGSI